jgi:hypothetical protein
MREGTHRVLLCCSPGRRSGRVDVVYEPAISSKRSGIARPACVRRQSFVGSIVGFPRARRLRGRHAIKIRKDTITHYKNSSGALQFAIVRRYPRHL